MIQYEGKYHLKYIKQELHALREEYSNIFKRIEELRKNIEIDGNDKLFGYGIEFLMHFARLEKAIDDMKEN